MRVKDYPCCFSVSDTQAETFEVTMTPTPDELSEDSVTQIQVVLRLLFSSSSVLYLLCVVSCKDEPPVESELFLL